MTDPMPLDEPIQELTPGKIERPATRDLLHDEREVIGAQDEVKRLARLPRFEYEQSRGPAAKEMGIRVSALDRLVRAEQRKSEDSSGFWNLATTSRPRSRRYSISIELCGSSRSTTCLWTATATSAAAVTSSSTWIGMVASTLFPTTATRPSASPAVDRAASVEAGAAADRAAVEVAAPTAVSVVAAMAAGVAGTPRGDSP